MPTKRNGGALVLEYLRSHAGEPVHHQTLRVLSGIDDVPRCLRLLRQQGWPIEPLGGGISKLTEDVQGTPRGTRKGISDRIRYRVLFRDGFMCRACGQSAKDGVKLNVDHIIPVDQGGTNELGNLQTLCEYCNHGKQGWAPISR